MAKLAAVGAFVSVLALAPLARAQWVAPAGDQGGDAGGLSGFLASAPLRLSLTGSIFPMGGSFPNCATREEAAGNSVGGMPVQHYVAFHLTPNLVLSGFSQLGCPIDAGIGGALTYAAPLGRSAWLVFGGGVYGAPGQVPLYGGLSPALLRSAQGSGSAFSMSARADVMWKASATRTYHVGVQTMGRTPSVMFGGGF